MRQSWFVKQLSACRPLRALIDSDGIERWTRQFGTPFEEYATGLAAGPNGDLYLTGITSGAFSTEPNAGLHDVFVAKLRDRSGQTSTGLRFLPVTPCRIMETRSGYNFQGRTGNFGPPFMRAGETRTLQVATSNVCRVDALASAYALNITVIPRSGLDFLTVWPAGEPKPNVWSARSPDGQVVANSAIVKVGPGGTISIYASDEVDVTVDISGIFTEGNASGLVYYPLTPCRVVETRAAYRAAGGPFGPPTMGSGDTRRFQFPSSQNCSVPGRAGLTRSP